MHAHVPPPKPQQKQSMQQRWQQLLQCCAAVAKQHQEQQQQQQQQQPSQQHQNSSRSNNNIDSNSSSSNSSSSKSGGGKTAADNINAPTICIRSSGSVTLPSVARRSSRRNLVGLVLLLRLVVALSSSVVAPSLPSMDIVEMFLKVRTPQNAR
jgi:hypothetical protein